MTADHVTLLATFLVDFWAAGCSKKVAIVQKNCLIFSILGNLLEPELIIKGWEGLINPCQFRRTVYWHCENDKNVGILLLATNGLSFTDKGPV